jgi:hypothetical protein
MVTFEPFPHALYRIVRSGCTAVAPDKLAGKGEIFTQFEQ